MGGAGGASEVGQAPPEMSDRRRLRRKTSAALDVGPAPPWTSERRHFRLRTNVVLEVGQEVPQTQNMRRLRRLRRSLKHHIVGVLVCLRRLIATLSATTAEWRLLHRLHLNYTSRRAPSDRATEHTASTERRRQVRERVDQIWFGRATTDIQHFVAYEVRQRNAIEIGVVFLKQDFASGIETTHNVEIARRVVASPIHRSSHTIIDGAVALSVTDSLLPQCHLSHPIVLGNDFVLRNSQTEV